MAQTTYRRTLVGQQPGVQINMPVDRTDRMLRETGDQTFAVVGHFSRGRIDKPFLVSASKLQRWLGTPKSMRANALNETYIQIFEAFSAGASAAVVSRVKSSAATNKWVLVKRGSSGNITTVASVPAASVHTDANPAWLVAFQFADCINEGMYFTVVRGTTSHELKIIVRERNKNSTGQDTENGEILYEFTGSIDAEAKDDFGNSYFIADVVAKYYGDWIKVEVNGSSGGVGSNDAFNARPVSAPVECYTDTSTPTAADYQNAANALGKTSLQYRYIMNNISNVTLVNALLEIGQKWNRILVQEISGNLSGSAARTWKNQFQYDAQGGMYCLWIWSPILRNDPTGATGQFQFGTVGQKVGRACARNGITNGYGLPALNQPIAGKKFYITGTNVQMLETNVPDDVEAAALAKEHINPVAYVTYHDGSGYVWDDSLSGAKRNGISRLENAVEISCWVQERFGQYARSLIHLPMTESMQAMDRFVSKELSAMEASQWLTSSTKLNGQAFSYVIAPNERDPDTVMDVTVNLSIDGVVRQININTNLYSRS